MKNIKYDPEQYWSEVGARIRARGANNVIAGDDEPYYRYKRRQFLKLLHSIDFYNKTVLEVGCGPGGNLLEVLKHKPSALVGVDISSAMIALAKMNVPEEVKIFKTNGTQLDFEDQSFDIVFTATVLQHNTDENMLRLLIREICRVSADKVFLFERIEDDIVGDELCLGRPIEYYSKLMRENGFALMSHAFINIRVSYYVCGAIRKLLNPPTRKEGEPLTKISLVLQKLMLPWTRVLDKIFTSDKDIAKLEFQRIK